MATRVESSAGNKPANGTKATNATTSQGVAPANGGGPKGNGTVTKDDVVAAAQKLGFELVEAFGDEDGDIVVGGKPSDADGDLLPQWRPQWREFRDEIIAEKLATLAPGSTAREKISGTLSVMRLYAERRYVVTVTDKQGNKAAMQVPRHGSLTSKLDKLIVPCLVALTFEGEDKEAQQPAQRAPYKYAVRARTLDGEGSAIVSETNKRTEEPLLAEQQANEKKRKAKKGSKEKSANETNGAASA